MQDNSTATISVVVAVEVILVIMYTISCLQSIDKECTLQKEYHCKAAFMCVTGRKLLKDPHYDRMYITHNACLQINSQL